MTDHTLRSSILKYNLYTIEPGFDIGEKYVGECSGLLTAGTTYHDSSYDGLSSYFKPLISTSYDLNLGPIGDIILQDDICFVAQWY